MSSAGDRSRVGRSRPESAPPRTCVTDTWDDEASPFPPAGAEYSTLQTAPDEQPVHGGEPAGLEKLDEVLRSTPWTSYQNTVFACSLRAVRQKRPTYVVVSRMVFLIQLRGAFFQSARAESCTFPILTISSPFEPGLPRPASQPTSQSARILHA